MKSDRSKITQNRPQGSFGFLFEPVQVEDVKLSGSGGQGGAFDCGDGTADIVLNPNNESAAALALSSH